VRYKVTRRAPEFQSQQQFSYEDLLAEEWRPIYLVPIKKWGIVNFEGTYEASNLGRVKSMKNYHGFSPNRILNTSPDGNGYLKVTLSMYSRLHTIHIHKLVALLFKGPCPPKHEINHKGVDGNKANNRADNLEYVTRKGNMERCVKSGLFEPTAKRSARMKFQAARGDENGSRTHPERQARGDRHGSITHPKALPRGEDNHMSKLSDKKRRKMIREYEQGGISYKQLGLKYGLCAQSVWQTVRSQRRLRALTEKRA
jgi:hypothetical protein